jgi:Domain of unknown function (DUF4185)
MKPAIPKGFAFLFCAITASVAGCSAHAPPGPSVTATELCGDIIAADGSRSGVLYHDGGQSIAVQGGTLWVFGDTFLGHRANPTTQPDSLGSVGTTIAFLPQEARTLPPDLRYFANSDGIATTPLALFADEDPKKFRMWPAGGVAVGGRTYLFYSMIESTDDPGPWNFRSVGSGLAVADQPLSKFQRLTPDGSWHFPVEAICVLQHEGLLYCYQVCNRPNQKGLIVARVAPADIENPSAYRFFNGQDWSLKPESAKVILREAYGQASVLWNPALRAFLLATSSDFFHPQEIQLRTARDPWGPWSEPTRIRVQPRPEKTTKLVYGTFIHPELSSEDGGEVVLTFCRNLEGDWELSNPELMRVHLQTSR